MKRINTFKPVHHPLIYVYLSLHAYTAIHPRGHLGRVAHGPDSVMVRAFTSEAGGAGSNPGRVILKALKMVPVATLLGAQH